MGASTDRILHELLEQARGLSREQELARRNWVGSFSNPGARESLFELEALLKGIAAIGDRRNLPGLGDSGDEAKRNADEPRLKLEVLHAAVARAGSLCRMLLGAGDHTLPLSRYLESPSPHIMTQSRSLQELLQQSTPAESLSVLSWSLDSYLRVIQNAAAAEAPSEELFASVQGLLVREVARSTYFNPLIPLEFRPEFDRIRVPAVLEALEQCPVQSALRVLSLCFLALFRCLRYLALVDQYATKRNDEALAYAAFAVLRSDLRVLCRFVGTHAAANMSQNFEDELLTLSATELKAQREELSNMARELVALRALLESTANAIRIDARLIYDKEIPPLGAEEDKLGAGASLAVAAASLRAVLHHAVFRLAANLLPEERAIALGSNLATRRDASRRLRRELWMFSQVLRAFLDKSKATSDGAESWADGTGYRFVGDFLGHFRAMGFQLVRGADYDRLEPLLDALEPLRARDLLDEKRLQVAIQECAALQQYVDDLFAQVSQREELGEVPFDKREAARSLRVYLAAGD